VAAFLAEAADDRDFVVGVPGEFVQRDDRLLLEAGDALQVLREVR